MPATVQILHVQGGVTTFHTGHISEFSGFRILFNIFFFLYINASFSIVLGYPITSISSSSSINSICNLNENEWTVFHNLGYNALLCQCELIKSLHHFNFHTDLLNSIISRAFQPIDRVSTLCITTLKHLLSHDITYEISYEIIKIAGSLLQQPTIKTILQTNFASLHNLSSHSKSTFSYKILNMMQNFIKCLECVKITVHKEEAKSIRKKAKTEKKKRKRDETGVAASVAESNATVSVTLKKRFQSDTLDELSLIYFRFFILFQF
jgi:hypothetical protein